MSGPRIGVIGLGFMGSRWARLIAEHAGAELDLARWCAGDLARVWAASSRGVLAARGYDVDDLYSVGLAFTGGAHATATIGWSLPARTPSYGRAGFTVIGEHGVLQVSQGATGFLAVGPDGPVDVDVHYAPEVQGHLRGALGIEVDHFVRCVRGEAEPACTVDDGTEAVRPALAMGKAAETGAVVAVHPDRAPSTAEAPA